MTTLIKPAGGDPPPLSQDKPRWVAHLENNLLADDDIDDVQRDLLGILRDMLEALGDDITASSKAAQRILEYCVEAYPSASAPSAQSHSSDVLGFINEVASLSFELTCEVPFQSSEHERLVRLVIDIKGLGPQAFGVEDLDFQPYDEAVGIAVETCWNRYQVPSSKTENELREKCESALSIATLFARLFEAGILGVRGSQFAAICIAEGLGLRESRAVARTELARWCEGAIAAQYILISGAALANEIRSPSQRPVYPLGKDEWRAWTAGFKTLAQNTPENAEWNLKQDAARAHDRMVELFPELFPELLGNN
ncbi:hypothetical protein GGS23DRAFT_274439 [Durotheca rogersii]|uniref:uncharacterized protein n=1 Tax=Durotheca rogersii TaxID=419775 RepID=UPI002220CBDC|nr:uncharacterized protein GGS23DRAFT_274439 [Durotheca rogersii]KAI5866500.1 hypothetical protein GGS23DRAFT_274439 [Durotheca rogersii]